MNSSAASVMGRCGQVGEIDRILDAADSPAVVQALNDATEEARALGAFGWPTFAIVPEIFWGDDHLEKALRWARDGGGMSNWALHDGHRAQRPAGGTLNFSAPFCTQGKRIVFMSGEILVHASSNGDRWFLVRDDGDPQRWRVRHQPNRASGGRATTVDVAEFLAEGHGPQHDAIQRHLQQLGYGPLSQ